MTRVILVARPEERMDHLALKLAAFAMFHESKPIVDPSSSHPSFSNIDVRPDLVALDEGGGISLWIECGNVSLNKLDKAARRLPGARVIVLQPTLRDASQLRQRLTDSVRQADKIAIWTWPGESFNSWMKAVDEKTEIFGEAREKSFNLVINDHPYSVDLIDA